MKLNTVKDCQEQETGAILAEICMKGKGISKTQKKLKSQKAKAWPYTCALFAKGEIPFEDAYAETGDVMDVVRDVFVDNIDNEILNTISTDKDDNLKFRSDPSTADMWKFASVFSRAIIAGVTWEECFEHPDLDGKLPSKGHIEALTKAKKSNLEKLEKVLETAGAICENMKDDSAEDRTKAQELISELLLSKLS